MIVCSKCDMWYQKRCFDVVNLSKAAQNSQCFKCQSGRYDQKEKTTNNVKLGGLLQLAKK